LGSYTTLSLGPIEYSWKGYVPSYVALFFDADDFKFDSTYDEAGRESVVTGLAFVTTASTARNRLESAGYTLGFFADVYERFRPAAKKAYEAGLEAERWASQLDGDPDKRPASRPDVLVDAPPLQELNEYVAFMRKDLAGMTAPRQRVAAHDAVRLSYLPPPAALVSSLFDPESFMDYPDVTGLLDVRLILEALPPQEPVKLDLLDVFLGGYLGGEAAAIRTLLDRLLADLAERVVIHDKVFES
jgi:hypothetical protein